MRRLIKIVLALFISLGFLVTLIPVTEAKEKFDINKHQVEMEVHEDGSVLVTETLTVQFTRDMHGIYFDIPRKYNMTWELNGETIRKSYDFPVRKVKVLSGQNKDITSYSNYIRIKLGSSSITLPAGHEETYKVQYEIVTRDLELNGLQMLFMNIISGKWNTDIHSVEFTIDMPKPFNRDKLLFDTPEGVTSTSSGPFNLVVTGNTISGSYNETMHPGDAITVQLMLENNYFRFVSTDRYGLIGTLIAGVFTIIMTIRFYVFGKDDPVVESVEFHAPAGMTSAEVGVIIDGITNDGDVISLILDWGRRGLITIKDDEKEGLILEKKADLESTAREYESIMFDKLFKNRESVKIKNLKNSFYTTIQKTETALDRYFLDKERKLYTESSEIMQIISIIFVFVPVAALTFLTVYNYRYEAGSALLACAVEAVPMIMLAALLVHMENRKYMHRWYTKMLLFAVCAVLFFIPCMLMIYVVARLKVSSIYVIMVMLMNVLIIVETVFMKKRTAYCNDLLGQVLGLRNFIIVAEEDRLKALVEENPYYFYDILPFAYALGLTNVWNEHFRNLTIQPCDWYVTYDYRSPYYMTNSLESHMHVMERDLTTPPPSESSSGGASFGGGGGSSGGFSGGGFGGSSGGGW
ncbi:MAG: DUF2207 domain-containing protein [Erysipelotrichaceae bacterium]|nr:DUF2207 domain-containing protein [Erysipelotrichaceae bacterium]